MASDPKKPYGDVSYADPGYQKDGKKRYPLDTEAHCKAAWSYINQAKNAAQYTAEQVTRIKARIKAAGKKYGIDFAEHKSAPQSEEGDPTVAAVERRFTTLPVELRAAGEHPKIGGYAAVFNRASRNLGGFIEVVTPSFFNKSRGDGWPDVMARYNHDDNQLLGTTAAGTLVLSVDDVGLDYTVIPPKSRADIAELVERGDIRKSSFAFRVGGDGDDWGLSEQGYPMRSLLSGQLVDVAPVNTPAYVDSTAGLRSLAEKFEAELDEVRSMAAADELRRFFARTDGPAYVKPKPKTFGASAAAALLARKSDPWR